MSQYQSLYRRFRPQTFAEVKGQEHVIRALQNAVRDNRVSHAYLFSGPRGTGKTSTARILAKALNCQALQTDGEPCDKCESCAAVQNGSSLDVHELDAASNNGVDAMRDLVSRAALGTPGRWKVYIIDEVHMLSTAASNALLKTLEEPPAHVVFVLATTDPQKVLPTIRSRTQHLEFRLLPGEVISQLLSDVRDQAHLDIAQEALEFAVRRGNGSARDALSLLDQVAASGSAHDVHESLDDIINGLIENDTSVVLAGVAESIHSGSDARRLATDIVEHLRNAFLSTMSKGLVPLPDEAIERVAQQAHQLGTARTVRIMELVGQALVDMRDTVDPRLTLELALIRATSAGGGSGVVDNSALSDLEARIRRLETHSTSSDGAAISTTSSAPSSSTQASLSKGSPADARVALGALKDRPRANTSAQATRANEVKSKEVVTEREFNRDELVKAWGDSVLESLPQRARARYRTARFGTVDSNTAQVLLPNQIHLDRCEEIKGEVEHSLSQFFGQKIKLQLKIDIPSAQSASPVTHDENEEEIDVNSLLEANKESGTVEDRVKEIFPGAEEVS